MVPVHVDAVMLKPSPAELCVVDGQGRPVVGAQVLKAREGRVVGVTDSRGRFEVPSWRNSYYVRHPDIGFGTISSMSDVVTLREPARLAVSARWQGQLMPGVTVRQRDSVLAGEVFYEDGTPVSRGTIHCWQEGPAGESLSGTEVVAGRFRLEVPPGACQLAASDAFAQSDPIPVQAPAENLVLVVPARGAVAGEDQEVLQARKRMFQQFGLVFKMYANEHQHMVFPPLSRVRGGFYPEMTEVYPEYLIDSKFVARATGRGDVKMCYLGYLVDDEASALAFLDAYAELGPEAIYGEDLQVAPGQGSFAGDTIFRLSEDFEWAEEVSQATIPTLWELPGPSREDGGWVLYMDGHVEWTPYPGDFPMTEAVARRIEALRAEPSGE